MRVLGQYDGWSVLFVHLLRDCSRHQIDHSLAKDALQRTSQSRNGINFAKAFFETSKIMSLTAFKILELSWKFKNVPADLAWGKQGVIEGPIRKNEYIVAPEVCS